jgi:hypothetical protein
MMAVLRNAKGRKYDQCLRCHARIGMLGTASAKAFGVDKASISDAKRKLGIKPLDRSKATMAANLIAGKQPAWMIEAWDAEWRGVVDDYWHRCNDITIARMCDPDLRDRSDGMVKYYLNHEESKERCRKSALGSWLKIKRDPEKVAIRYRAAKRWRERNRDHVRKNMVTWAENNPERIRELRRRARIRPESKIRHNLRRRLRDILGSNSDTFAESVGCSAKQLKKYIEVQFTKNMTWGNYGTYWHIDHIQPLSSFDLRDPNQRRLATNWANLRPLEAVRNMRKSSKIEVPQLHLCMDMG